MIFEDKYFQKNLLDMNRFPKNFYHSSIKKAIKVSLKNSNFPISETNSIPNILEIGIGSGNKISIFKGYKVYGLDMDYRCIDYCKENFRGEFRLCNIEKDEIPFNEKFNVILMGEVIEHLNNPHNALEKIKSVLKEDGIFLLSTPNRSNLFYITYKLIPNQITHSYIDILHVKEYNRKEFKNLLSIYFNKVEIKKHFLGMVLFAKCQI